MHGELGWEGGFAAKGWIDTPGFEETGCVGGELESGL